MKLLYCPKCGDMFNLSLEIKTCSCGHAQGQYEPDGLYAIFSGGVPFCFSNNSFIAAIGQQAEMDRLDEIPFHGAKFDAWICPANSKTFGRVD